MPQKGLRDLTKLWSYCRFKMPQKVVVHKVVFLQV